MCYGPSQLCASLSYTFHYIGQYNNCFPTQSLCWCFMAQQTVFHKYLDTVGSIALGSSEASRCASVHTNSRANQCSYNHLDTHTDIPPIRQQAVNIFSIHSALLSVKYCVVPLHFILLYCSPERIIINPVAAWAKQVKVLLLFMFIFRTLSSNIYRPPNAHQAF